MIHEKENAGFPGEGSVSLMGSESDQGEQQGGHHGKQYSQNHGIATCDKEIRHAQDEDQCQGGEAGNHQGPSGRVFPKPGNQKENGETGRGDEPAKQDRDRHEVFYGHVVS